ncbi:hypothetical protein ER308_07755 [Egibacter rhizosphaerae]|uniref:CopG family transcriptional regulator n=1 Tax=Egibacter rhizosphaerae TaxID=1670831 RepID=A0A411YEC7_9ACTN|nr:hypothetical protein [Egibacter rhizosphaerae]QBI19457.1 hypothetical protein ER308_07755 [Egibacter rhizosphaerae]
MAYEDKQQFNVYLPPELIRRVKHAAVDSDTSLSGYVERVLATHLDRVERHGLDEASTVEGGPNPDA